METNAAAAAAKPVADGLLIEMFIEHFCLRLFLSIEGKLKRELIYYGTTKLLLVLQQQLPHNQWAEKGKFCRLLVELTLEFNIGMRELLPF